MKYRIIEENIGQGKYDVAIPVAYCNKLNNSTEPRCVKDILVDSYGEDFGLVLGNYVKMEPELLQKNSYFVNTDNFRLDSWKYIRTESVLGQPVEKTVVDFIVDGTVSGDYKDGEQIIIKTLTLKFRIRYVLDLRLCHRCCIGPLIFQEALWEEDPVFSGYRIKTDEYLIPILYKKDYDYVARALLDTYFPENIDRIGYFKVDAEELARRMGLKVVDVRFADNSTMGKIIYDHTIVTLLDEKGLSYQAKVRPGTILININNCVLASVRNSTIIHECCHMFLDRWFFLLQMFAGKPYSAYTSRMRTGTARTYNSPLDWMELHCDRLPAYILMESENTRAFIEEQLKKEANPYSVDTTRRVINAIANEYAVSKSMAKYRMNELGYHQAEGIYCFVDGVRIPDHGCSKPWPQGVTYAIDALSAAELMTKSPKFAAMVSSGEYLYANGHFCRNKSKYICQAKNGALSLSNYAREHMEECCLAFRVSAGNRDEQGHFGFASRRKKTGNADGYRVVYSLAAEQGTESYVKENEDLAYGSFAWGELNRNLPDDFNQAVKLILKELDVSQETVSLEMGKDRRELYRMMHADRVPIEKVIAFCVATKLPYFISDRLIHLSGNYLRYSDTDSLYRRFLLESGKITVDRCNDILKSKGFLPLIKQKEDSYKFQN